MFRKFLLAIGLLFGLIANSYAAIAINTCGVSTNVNATTTVLNSASTGAADIPANAIILISSGDIATTGSPGGGTVDSSSNTYTNITSSFLNGAAANGFMTLYYSTTGNAVALTGAGTITYTHGASSRSATNCVYITGAATSSPLDTAITATSNGSTGTVTVTSGTPGQTGNLYVGIFVNNNTNTFNQDTVNGWSSTGGPLQSLGNTAIRAIGGNQTGSGVKTFAPTINTSNGLWAIAVIGFKPLAAASATYRFKSLLGVGQ